MKTIKTKLVLLAFLPLLFFSITGCSSKDGRMSVLMTDAPAAYDAVYVDVITVMAKYDDPPRSIHPDPEGWIALGTHGGVYNLLELRNNVTVVIVPEQSLPPGHLKELRLILGDQNTVVVGGISFPMKVPSGSESGLKIKTNHWIEADESLVLILDFDAEQSVKVNGNGGYFLHPVIKLR